MGSYTNIEVEIEKVEIVSGNSLKPNWKSKMQTIKTNKGEFIDNMPGVKKNTNTPEGFDWKAVQGQKVKAKFVINSDYKWLTIDESVGTPKKTKISGKVVPSFTLAKERGMKTEIFHQKIAEAGYTIKNEAGVYLLTEKGKISGIIIKENTYGQFFMLPEHVTI
jgi:hypothetical protein